MAEIEAQAAKDKATSERHEKDRISGKEIANESDEKNKQQLGRTDIEGIS